MAALEHSIKTDARICYMTVMLLAIYSEQLYLHQPSII